MRRVFAGLVMACGVSLALAKAPGDGITFLEDGILTSASKAGVLRLDVATGVFEIRYPDGRVHRDALAPYIPPERNAMTGIPFMLLSAPQADAGKHGPACGRESENRAAAMRLTAGACDDSTSNYCNSARKALHYAMDAFDACASAAAASSERTPALARGASQSE